jgi:hypothetical protein
MVRGAIKGAEKAGYTLKRQPGRGLSNTYEVTKDGKTRVASVRTTQDRAIAFPPLKKGTVWKTLSDVDLVLVAAVDDKDNPQSVYVHMIPADEVRKRFNASYVARIKAGHIVRDNYGMWITLDKGDSSVPSQVGHSLAVDYPAIAHFTIDELEAEMPQVAGDDEADGPVDPLDVAAPVDDDLTTIAEVLAFARKKIAALSGLSTEAISLDLKMGL